MTASRACSLMGSFLFVIIHEYFESTSVAISADYNFILKQTEFNAKNKIKSGINLRIPLSKGTHWYNFQRLHRNQNFTNVWYLVHGRLTSEVSFLSERAVRALWEEHHESQFCPI